MSDAPHSSDDITDKIRTGEFFRQSQQAYHLSYHDPMTERYFFIGITAVSVLMVLLSLTAIILLHPLSSKVPLIYNTQDIVEDLPVIRALGSREQDPNFLLKQFLTSNFLKLWEEYSIETVERNRVGIQSQSTAEVFKTYQAYMTPSNPNSPISKYQRRALRVVEPTGYEYDVLDGQDQRMTIYFRAQVIAGTDIGAERKRAIITFRFDDIAVNQKTGEKSPLNFVVTDYQVEDVG